MGRIIAFDWDATCLRCIVASASGHELTIHTAATVTLVPAADTSDDLAARLSNALRQALADQSVRRVTTLVGVPRASVELLHLTLPPAKDAELPELVLNQVFRESPNLTDEAVVDFISTDDDSGNPRQVTAAVFPARQLAQVQAVCAHAGLRATRIVLRSYASASLAARTAPAADAAYLLVNLVGDEADLCAVADGKILLSRTARLPVGLDEEKTADRLIGEIRRTLSVVPRAVVSERPIQTVLIFGRTGQYQVLVEQIERQLDLPTVVLDPFEAVEHEGDPIMDDPGPFAALLGMALQETRGETHAVDFLHPRKPATPPSRRRVAGLAAATVATIALLAGYYIWSSLAEVDGENALLTKRLSELKKPVARAAKQKELVAAIRNWQSRNVNWLDEVNDLSMRFPPSNDALVLRMAMTTSRSGGGSIELDGLVRDPSVVVRMETDIRDQFHRVRSRRVQERVKEKAYTWLFETSISVAARTKEQYRSQLQLPAKLDRKPSSGVPEPAKTKRDDSP